jgi:hypothetical protein
MLIRISGYRRNLPMEDRECVETIPGAWKMKLAGKLVILT